MSENSKPEADVEDRVAPLSNDRILYAMCFVVIGGSLLGLIFISWRFGLGFFLGGILSFINYYWLKASLKTLFETAGEGEKPPFMAARYFWRYITIGAIILFVFLTKAIPVVAFVLGLVSFAFAVMIEAVLRIFSDIFRQKEF
jgi:hypothetical protein